MGLYSLGCQSSVIRMREPLSILSLDSLEYFQPNNFLSENHIYSWEFNNLFPYTRYKAGHYILPEIRPLENKRSVEKMWQNVKQNSYFFYKECSLELSEKLKETFTFLCNCEYPASYYLALYDLGRTWEQIY